MRILNITRAGSFPTQFTGQTYDGEYFYARYRHGELTVYSSGSTFHMSSESNNVYDLVPMNEDHKILEINDGTGDGIMEISTFLNILQQHHLFSEKPS